MPSQHQQVVRQLIPEYEQGLQGDFLQQIEATYSKYGAAAGLPSFDAMLAKMGETGRTIQQIRRSRQIIRQNALNYERLDEEVYDKSQGGPRTLNLTGQPPSSWSQIRPGVIAQLVVQQGNLGLNTLNFRVLPGATKTGSDDGSSLVRRVAFVPSEQTNMAANAIETGLFIYLFEIFELTIEGALEGKAISAAGQIRAPTSIVAIPLAKAQTLTMVPNSNKSSQQYVVRGGAGSAKSLQDGTNTTSNGYGFSVQTAPGISVNELARGGSFPNNQISVSTIQRLQAIPGVMVKAPTPGFGTFHGTVNLPYPPPPGLFDAVAAAFTQQPNPYVTPK